MDTDEKVASTPLSKESGFTELKNQLFGLTVSPVRSNRDRANLIRKALCLREEMNDSVGAVSGKMGELYISHAATIASVNFQNDLVETINSKMNEITEREKARDHQISELAFELMETKAALRNVKKETRENTMEIKSKNLVINGMPETKDENAINAVVKFLKNIDSNFSADKLENAYRLGQSSAKITRGMLVKFKNPAVKQSIMKKKSALKKNKECDKMFCNEDMPEDARKHRQRLRIIAKHANSIGYQNTRVKGNGIWHAGRMYKENELTLLPDCLKLENIRTRDIGCGIGFFGKDSFLSNHHPARIVMNEHRFLCSEQAYFYYKAVVCGHESTGLEIKKMLDPGEMKNLGEKIPTCKEWEEKKLRVMKSVLTHKFEQNRELRDKLVGTGTKPLLECSTDLVWGTGWVIDSPKWAEMTDYPGQNNLGKILENIRENYLPVTAMFDPKNLPQDKNVGQNLTSTPMVNPAKKSSKKRRMPSHSSKPSAKQAITDVSNHDEADKEASAQLDPDNGTLPSKLDGDLPLNEELMQVEGATGSADDPVEKQKEQLSVSQALEVEEITFTDTLYQSYDARNVSNKDGSLNVEKIRSWGLPALNTSRLMEVTGYGSDGAREKLRKLLAAQNTGESYIDTDPSNATPVETVTRKTLVASRQTRPVSEKKKLDKLLENI